jgi:hypothetical protein
VKKTACSNPGLVDQIICPITNSWFAGISEVASRPNILQNLWAYRKEIIEKKKKKTWMDENKCDL